MLPVFYFFCCYIYQFTAFHYITVLRKFIRIETEVDTLFLRSKYRNINGLKSQRTPLIIQRPNRIGWVIFTQQIKFFLNLLSTRKYCYIQRESRLMYLRLSCKPRIQRMNFPNDYFPWAQRIYWAYQKKGIQILWLRKVQILGNTETHYDCSCALLFAMPHSGSRNNTITA